MRNRFLIGLAAALALGALLDTTVPHEHVGLRTVGERVRASIDPPVEHFQAFDLVEQARDYGGGVSGVTIHVAIRDLAPGAVIIIDEAIPPARLPSLFLRGIGGAGSVFVHDLSGVPSPAGPPTAEGLYFTGVWQQSWAIWAADDASQVLLVVQDGDTTNVIDGRLLSEAALTDGLLDRIRAGAEPPARTLQENHRGVLRAAFAEWSVLMLLLVLGGALLPIGSFRNGSRLPLAFLVGVALHSSLAILLLSGGAAMLVTIGVAASLATLAQRAGTRVGWRLNDVPWLVAAGSVVGLVIVGARARSEIVVVSDSFDYWSGGAVLARGDLGLRDLDVKRGLSQQALHSAGFTLGAGGVPTVGHVLLVAGLLIVVAAALVRSARSLRSPVMLVAVLFALAAALSPQIRTHAAMINGHVLVATLLLALVVLLGADAVRPLIPAIVAVVGALVVARPEGAALAALAILGASLARRGRTDRTPGPFVAPWLILGVAAIAWGSMLTAGQLLAEGQRARATDLLLLIGLLALAAGWLQRRVTDHSWRSVVLVGGAVVWAVTLLLLSQERVNFLEAAVANVGRGAGGWGVVGPSLLLAALVALVLTAGSGSADVQAARWVLIGFVPVALLSKLGDGLQTSDAGFDVLLSGGGRVGWTDSVNRMWMHAVIVIGYLLVKAAGRSPLPPAAHVAARSGRSTVPVMAAPLLALVLLGPWIALQWQPDYVPWEPARDELLLVDAPGSEAMVELVDGTIVEEHVPLEIPLLGGGSVPIELCVLVPLVTFGRDIDGQVLLEFELEQNGSSAERMLVHDEIVDWNPNRACVSLDDPSSDGGEQLDVRARLTSVGPVAGAAPGAVRATELRRFGASVSVPSDDGIRTGRDGSLALALSLVVAEPPGVFDRPVQRGMRMLPWLVLLLGGGAAVSRFRDGI